MSSNYEPQNQPLGAPGIMPVAQPNVLEGDNVLQQQYVTHDGYIWGGVHTLSPSRVEDVITNITPETFEQMSQDPKIHKSKRIRINGVLTDDLILAPGATEQEAKNSSEFKKYVTVMQFCERMIAGLDTPLWRVLEMMFDGGYEQGHKIAEVDYEYRLDTPTKSIQTEVSKRGAKPNAFGSTLRRMFGIQEARTDDAPAKRGTSILQKPQVRLMPKAIKVKPRGSVMFVVDAFMNVLGLVPAWMPGRASWTVRDVITRDKFMVFTNNPTDDDPRGNSAWRPAFWAWQFKNFIPKQYLTYLLNEAVPVPVLELPKGMAPYMIKRDAEGRTLIKPGTVDEPWMEETIVSAERTLKNIRGGKGVAIPPESKLTGYGGNRGGSQDTVFPNAIRSADEQIEESIVLQGLAQSIGKSSSQKGAETHENRLTDLFFWDKRLACVMILYDFFAVGVRENLGAEMLPYLPKASLGDSQKRDWAKDLEVISRAYFYGFIDDSMRAELCAWLGLPKPGISARQEQIISMAQQGKEGTPAPANSNRPDKQPGQTDKPTSTPKKTQFFDAQGNEVSGDEMLSAIYNLVRNAEVQDFGFSNVGNYTPTRNSFVQYGYRSKISC